MLKWLKKKMPALRATQIFKINSLQHNIKLLDCVANRKCFMGSFEALHGWKVLKLRLQHSKRGL